MESNPQPPTTLTKLPVRNPRGTYTAMACNFCRQRKTKCNGARPICDTCANSGHECTWGPEQAKRPGTKQYVDSLKKHSQALEAYATRLESLLERCRIEHGGFEDRERLFLQNRPMATDYSINSELYELKPDSDGEEAVVPLGSLVLEEQDLLFHGTTSIYRPLRRSSVQVSRYPEILDNPNERYVLLVEGGDQGNFDASFNWSRHLPPQVALDRYEHDRLLDLFFKFFTSWCLRILPALFLRDMARALSVPASQPSPRTTHYSPMLHNAVLALGCAFSDDPRLRDIETRQHFARAAKDFLEVDCQNPNISVVTALAFLASFHSTQGDSNLGYVYFGMSTRISQALGLEIDCSKWVEAGLITRDDMLDRNWAYWTTFNQDVCRSLSVGRDFSLPVPSSRQNIPIPEVEHALDDISWSHSPTNPVPQKGYLSSTFVAQTKLLIIARSIMDTINRIGTAEDPRQINYELVSKIDVELNAWKDSLTPEVDMTLSMKRNATPQRLMLHLAYWWLFILLHRPFYRQSRSIQGPGAGIDHSKLCNRAADNILDLLAIWHSLYDLRFVPATLYQTTFAAGTVYLLSAVQALSGVRLATVSLTQSLERLDSCIRHLHQSGHTWQCSNNTADTLRNMLRKQLEPRLQERGLLSPTPQTSQPQEALEDGGSITIHRSQGQNRYDKGKRREVGTRSQNPDIRNSSTTDFSGTTLHPHPHPHPHTLMSSYDIESSANFSSAQEQAQPGMRTTTPSVNPRTYSGIEFPYPSALGIEPFRGSFGMASGYDDPMTGSMEPSVFGAGPYGTEGDLKGISNEMFSEADLAELQRWLDQRWSDQSHSTA